MKKITSVLLSLLFVITAMFTGCDKQQAANSADTSKGKALVYGVNKRVSGYNDKRTLGHHGEGFIWNAEEWNIQ